MDAYQNIIASTICVGWAYVVHMLRKDYQRNDSVAVIVPPTHGLRELSAAEVYRARRWLAWRVSGRMNVPMRLERNIRMCGSWGIHRNLIKRGYSLGEALDLLGIARRYSDPEINGTRPVE